MSDDDINRKTQAEIDKLKAEAEALRRPIPYAWTNWISLIVGFGAVFTAVVGGIIQWSASNYQLERQKLEVQTAVVASREEILKLKNERSETEDAKKLALAELAAAREQVAAAKRDLDRIQAEAQAAAAKTNDPASRQSLNTVATSAATASENLARRSQLVYLHFRGAIDRDIMRELQARLRAAGYSAPGIERIAGNYTSEIRYFKKDDQDDAKYIGSIATKLFGEKKCTPQTPIDPRFVDVNPVPNQIEVWVFLTCPE